MPGGTLTLSTTEPVRLSFMIFLPSVASEELLEMYNPDVSAASPHATFQYGEFGSGIT
jgi:hypothetical protein